MYISPLSPETIFWGLGFVHERSGVGMYSTFLKLQAVSSPCLDPLSYVDEPRYIVQVPRSQVTHLHRFPPKAPRFQFRIMHVRPATDLRPFCRFSRLPAEYRGSSLI